MSLFGDSGCGAGDGLGDLVCTNEEARAAGQAVKYMQQIFANLGSPNKWAAQVAAVNAAWDYYAGNAATTMYRDFTLCNQKSVGQQAQALTNQMLIDAGKPPLTQNPQLNPGPSSSLADALQSVAVVGLVGTVGWFGYDLFKRHRRTS